MKRTLETIMLFFLAAIIAVTEYIMALGGKMKQERVFLAIVILLMAAIIAAVTFSNKDSAVSEPAQTPEPTSGLTMAPKLVSAPTPALTQPPVKWWVLGCSEPRSLGLKLQNLRDHPTPVEVKFGGVLMYWRVLEVNESRHVQVAIPGNTDSAVGTLKVFSSGDFEAQEKIDLPCKSSSSGSSSGSAGDPTAIPPPPVPELPTVALVGVGLLGLFAVARLKHGR